MYIPKHFIGGDQLAALDFIEANGFAQLVGLLDGELFCTHIPLLLDRTNNRLLGHLARGNPQAQALLGQRLLCIFSGPHDYISPSWYQSPGVPTWNYQAAHVYGACTLVENADVVHDMLKDLTAKYEAQETVPWTPDYKPSMINAIVAFEIVIERIDLKFKLSQNRSVEDQKAVVQALRLRNSQVLADAMVRHLKLED